MATDVQSETLSRRPVESDEGQRDEWVAAVEQVVSDAEAWATEQHWSVHRGPKTITERRLGTYEVPALLIWAPAGRFVLDPIARYVGGVLGRIDLRAFPSYDDAMIVRTEAGWYWVIDPPTLDRPWSKEAFFKVTAELARKA
jgi:hypothetical protein